MKKYLVGGMAGFVAGVVALAGAIYAIFGVNLFWFAYVLASSGGDEDFPPELENYTQLSLYNPTPPGYTMEAGFFNWTYSDPVTDSALWLNRVEPQMSFSEQDFQTLCFAKIFSDRVMVGIRLRDLNEKNFKPT